ncbi:MAG: tRNA epoxyqueuosine(34) reductase QueG [Ignavibacteriales bacterium]|nr:tRNA epoxyqueuosine(34) reductase QueG [Ignavibacteriales bacterium]
MKLTNQIIIEKAKEIGFDLIGFAKADLLQNETEKLKEWLSKGFHASMDYMERNFEKRFNLNNILPNAKSVISLAINYYTDHKYTNEKGFGKVSRYAWGKDYHLVIWEKLEILEEQLKEIDPSFNCLTYVDTGPVMDKAWAVRSGIGWLGKHTNVITREMGSWIFLATIICNQEFNYDEPIEDFCGSCRACLNACPTNAIVDEYVVDANKCISFLTIENKGEISGEFKNQFDDWLFGCDICQDVCPWNKKFPTQTRERKFEPNENKEIPLREIIEMDSEDFKKRFEISPIKRAKLNGIKRNAEFIMKNR